MKIKLIKYNLRLLAMHLLIPLGLIAQSQAPADSSGLAISAGVSTKYIHALNSRSADAQAEMEKETGKYLDKLKNQELILQKQLSKIDPAAATRIFSESAQKYDKLQNDLNNNSENVLKSCGKYFPGIDSALTSLKFLQQNPAMAGKLGSEVTQIKSAMSKVQALEDQFKKTDNVEDFVKQREQYLQQQLSSFNLPGLGQYNQQAAYFAQSMSEVKQDWDDPSRIEKKAVSLLNKMPAFQDFMTKNSMIAGLFNLPNDYETSGVAGLQTKDEVQKVMQQAMQTLGPNGGQTAQQNIGDAQSSLSTLRTKLNQGSSELAMPDGQGNNQHTKSLFRRLEYGVNIQNTRSTNFFPTTTYFAGTIGYRLNAKSTAGVGASFNMGWGNSIQHISISNQGMGLRSFLDVQIKGSFFASGGLERNYNKIITPNGQPSVGYIWQNSGLIGISKIISLKGNLVKKTKVQLLWDVLSYYQTPKTQPVVFRLGYSF